MFNQRSPTHFYVSEELSSVETFRDLHIAQNINWVSEELSSVETKIKIIKSYKTFMFQKNLVVWKLM